MNTASENVTVVTCLDGSYSVNERLLRRVIASYYRAQANWQFRREEPVDTGWLGPDVKVPAVDWKQARSWTERQTNSELYNHWLQSLPRMGPRLAKLNYMQSQAIALQAQFREWSRSLQRRNSAAIEQRAADWGMAADVATGLRDTSGTILMAGAMVVPAGAAAVGVGLAGTGLRAWAKFQDARGPVGRRVGAAMVHASGDLIFSVIPLTKAGAVMRDAKGSGEATLIVLESMWDSQVSLLEGKEVADSLQDGAMTLLWKGVQARYDFDKKLAERLQNWVLPGAIRVAAEKKEGTRLAKAVARGAVGSGSAAAKKMSGDKISRLNTGGSGISDTVLATSLSGEGSQHAAVINRDLVRLAVQRLN